MRVRGNSFASNRSFNQTNHIWMEVSLNSLRIHPTELIADEYLNQSTVTGERSHTSLNNASARWFRLGEHNYLVNP